MNFEVKSRYEHRIRNGLFYFLIGSTLTTTISGGTPRRMGITDRPCLLYTSEHYIFTTGKGGPIDIAFANKILRSIHYHKRLSTHIFRHTHVSLLAESGVSLKAIMARVGHNDPATTMAIYTPVSYTHL